MTTWIDGTASSIPLSYTLPGYRFRRLIGEDSIGLWFDAEQESLARYVTIRVLRPKFEGNATARRSFVDEMNRLVKLASPHVTRVLFTVRADTLAVVTERVDGRTLARLLGPGRPLGEPTSLRCAAGAARGLLHLQEHGLAFKNVTPRLVQTSGGTMCRLVPFRNLVAMEGFALMRGKLAQDPQYVAPEQLVGRHPIGPKTPVYQVGALLWHMLTGQAPFPGTRPAEIAKAHVTSPFPSLKRLQPFLSPGVYDLVDRCTARNPATRPVLADLVGQLDGAAAQRPATAAPKLRRRRRR